MVDVADTPREFATRVILALRDRSETQSKQLRVQLKRYVESLGLSAQLNQVLRAPNAGLVTPGARDNEVAGLPA